MPERTLQHGPPTAPAEDLYFVRAWGNGVFSINERGHAVVHPCRDRGPSIDIYRVVRKLKERGHRFPLLLRFQDLLQTSVVRLNESFRKAVSVTGYPNRYQGVFPVKVNQLREVVEEILEAGRPYGHGLEAGSKTELTATLPYLTSDDMLLVVNGSKDESMMRLMLSGQKLGKNILPVLERYDEYEQFSRLAHSMEVKERFGVRVRLSTTGAGLWSESGGENSKFGISLTELLALIDRLKREGRTDAFRLLHFHLGSQIADLGAVRQAVMEAGRLYVELHRRGIGVRYLDIGGGLGVSYEAGNSSVPGSINYTLDEYTLAVVQTLDELCDREAVPAPIIVSESGRAVTAFHSVLVLEVIGARAKDAIEGHDLQNGRQGLTGALHELYARSEAVRMEERVELFRQVEALRSRVVDAFRRGEMSLEDKALAERLYWSICRNLYDGYEGEPIPEDFADLEAQLLDHYLCNFSVFRSMSDYWAIGQRFPIMPLHRLNEPPERRAKLVDLTCDSDGQVDEFVAPSGNKRYLELHDLRPGEPYYLGVFLTGAYQDIMGDMHNLFGRVTEAHVYADADEPDQFYIEKIIPGATIEEQLALVQYFPNDLERRMENLIAEKVRAGRLRPKEGVRLLEQYRRSFAETTYLHT